MSQPGLVQASERAQHIAHEHGYGPWVQSLVINSGVDRRSERGMLMLVLLAPWPFLWMAYESGPWQPDGGSTAGLIASGLAGLIFLALAVFSAVSLVRGTRVGPAHAHLFERAMILERAGGSLAAFHYYDDCEPRFVHWKQPWEGQDRDRVQLWIEVEGYGRTICLDGFAPRDAAPLPVIARALGLGEQPEPIGAIRGTGPTPF